MEILAEYRGTALNILMSESDVDILMGEALRRGYSAIVQIRPGVRMAKTTDDDEIRVPFIAEKGMYVMIGPNSISTLTETQFRLLENRFHRL